jgi:hypothetical protein
MKGYVMNQHAEILCWDVDLPVDNVFISQVYIVGQNSFLVKNPRDVQAFIEEELVNSGVRLAQSKAQAKMKLDCRITIIPMHESKVPSELLHTNTEYSSIVVEIQLNQKNDEQCRQPYYDNSGIHPELNEKVILGIQECLTSLLQKLHSKKNAY